MKALTLPPPLVGFAMLPVSYAGRCGDTPLIGTGVACLGNAHGERDDN
jgi:hypothetical protein